MWAFFKKIFYFSFFIFFFIQSAPARQSFEFSLGDRVTILSDKAFRRSKDNSFEAIGNVIIKSSSNSIYGEKASMQLNTGETTVIGNVRYIAPDMTLYGTNLKYNFKTDIFEAENARLVSDNYVIVGKHFIRPNPQTIYAKDAEYTTCKDCPESWSVFGKEVTITVGKYVRVKHAYLKAKGVVVLYVPYIVFPIKSKRETGFLFPSFNYDIDEGVRFQQPWFWNISPSTDLTLSPAIFGRRGAAGEASFRQVLGENFWYDVENFSNWDQIYQENKITLDESGESLYRHFTEWEHHYSSDKNFNHHAYYNFTRDLDVTRDYEIYTFNRMRDSAFGLDTFLDWRTNWTNVTTEASFKRNQLYDQTFGFDDRYVQVLPELTLSSVPIQLFQISSPFFARASFTLNSDFTRFKQNQVIENTFIRNANRINLKPELNLSLGQIGPVSINHKATLDYQYYDFEHETENYFYKRGVIYETSLSTELTKSFGLTYQKSVPKKDVIEKEPTKEESVDDEKEDTFSYIIGDIPQQFAPEEEYVTVLKKAYQHRQTYRVNHYFLSGQETKGNSTFRSQINSSNGQFDPVDAIREKEFQLDNVVSRTSLPLSNTVEVQWNNSLIEKNLSSDYEPLTDRRNLRDNFTYSQVAHFNISQGYDFNLVSDEFIDHLTRLYIDTGFYFMGLYASIQEYYYHSTNEHVFRLGLNKSFSIGSIFTSIRYDSFTTPIQKIFSAGGSLSVTSQLDLRSSIEYNIDLNRANRTTYGFTYSPNNNCWRFLLDYTKTLADRRYSFNFMFNFNDQNF